MVAGLRGGSGKTTLALGLTAAFRKEGLSVTPFKKGPDYIDAGWLAAAAGQPCYNLDPFLIGEEKVLASFRERSLFSDLSVIEGNRGLFDGMDAEGTFSSAKVARILSAPVLLVVDCTKMTRTAAALVLGARKFDPRLKLAGVVLNQVAGGRHESVVRESIEKYAGTPVLGAIPRTKEENFPERHMGLTPQQEHPDVERAIGAMEGLVSKYVDVREVLSIARRAPAPRRSPASCAPVPPGPEPPLRVGVIRDSAFQFYYPENLEELAKRGAEIREFSAIREEVLPPMDALYIGGGFPETHAIALSENRSLMRSLRRAVEGNLPVYAECGGLMYLGTSLETGGKTYPMAGVLPLKFSLRQRPQAHGYTVMKATRKSPFYAKGTVLRGHEFHYSEALGFRERKGVTFAFSMERGTGIAGGRDGLCYRNVFATYTHLHALGAEPWVEGMLAAAKRFRRSLHET